MSYNGVLNAQKSPFSSASSNVIASPVGARRGSAQERRRPACSFEDAAMSEPLLQRDHVAPESRHDDDALSMHSDRELGPHDDTGSEDDTGELTPLLPIFSAEQLDALPVYNITHTIRLLVEPRCETTLTWDQLRSPQVSQFLVKPIQQQIRSSNFSKATLYALMANCLQFSKEVQLNPGNSGVSRTKAMVCELLAIRLLKEFTTRELIDALSYDFNPLQGLPTPTGPSIPRPNWNQNSKSKASAKAARVSTLEVAIRAQAKRFLAHPLVVQQLEAIWAGTIVFHSAADNLHRPKLKVTPNQNRGYGVLGGTRNLRASPDILQPAKQRDHLEPTAFALRRSVTLYDPKQASLFKLSRLRVPRYRHFLSTCSLAALLALYLAVLVERSLSITPLEIIFWVWSAGFLLDEVVGFNEQGFSLYIMSFWNSFDIGILLLLLCYFVVRLYGVMAYEPQKQLAANMAYDLLAANAVLLFPRLFSILDHYRYFSQLLIAFRMMAADLMAVLVLIVISCSGFFVAFTMSFGSDTYDAASVAYALFQILMGFTPAAWESWAHYNMLGRSILMLFLFICHFLIVTILITVLTNSFMAVVQNANQEHQFVFAVNTISMVKSDALFSYIAPANVFGWLLSPLRFFVPLSNFVRVNRLIIKGTHFPVLFSIYLYERLILSRRSFEALDLVTHHPQNKSPYQLQSGGRNHVNAFSPSQGRLREPSVATFRKDRALDQVFQGPMRVNVAHSQRPKDQRVTSNVVKHWMSNFGPSGQASPPIEDDESILERLEACRGPQAIARQLLRRSNSAFFSRDYTEAASSYVHSDRDGSLMAKPLEDRKPPLILADVDQVGIALEGNAETAEIRDDVSQLDKAGDLATGPFLPAAETTTKAGTVEGPRARPRRSPWTSPTTRPSPLARQNAHTRKLGNHHRVSSTDTMIFDPPVHKGTPQSSRGKDISQSKTLFQSRSPADFHIPPHANNDTTKPRPIMPARHLFQSEPNLAGVLPSPRHEFRKNENRHSSFTLGLGSDLGDNNAIGGGFVLGGGVPASFATNAAFGAEIRATMKRNGKSADAGLRRNTKKHDPSLDESREEDESSSDDDDLSDHQTRMGKLVLARMNSLEEGFRDVVRELRDLRDERHASIPQDEDGHKGDSKTNSSVRAQLRKQAPTQRSGSAANTDGAKSKRKGGRGRPLRELSLNESIFDSMEEDKENAWKGPLLTVHPEDEAVDVDGGQSHEEERMARHRVSGESDPTFALEE